MRDARPKRCGRKLCPACGDLVLRQNVAHSVKRLAPALGQLVFLTLTLDGPADGASGRARLMACWNAFTGKVRYRARREGWTFRYVAHKQHHGGRWHLHAVAEAPLDPATLRGLWFEAGGGVDSDAQPVFDRDHLGAVVCYTLREFKRVGNGSVMYGGGIGYNTKAAKAERAEHARELYGHTWDPDFELVREPAGPASAGASAADVGWLDPDLPDTWERKTEAVSLCHGRYWGRYAVLSRYARGRVTVHPAVRVEGQWKAIGTAGTKRAARRAVLRRDARDRRAAGRRGG